MTCSSMLGCFHDFMQLPKKKAKQYLYVQAHIEWDYSNCHLVELGRETAYKHSIFYMLSVPKVFELRITGLSIEVV